MKANRHGRRWTSRDLVKLRALARAGLSARQAAPKLGRTTGAIKYKAMVERVRFTFVEQPRGVQRAIARAKKTRTGRKRRT